MNEAQLENLRAIARNLQQALTELSADKVPDVPDNPIPPATPPYRNGKFEDFTEWAVRNRKIPAIPERAGDLALLEFANGFADQPYGVIWAAWEKRTPDTTKPLPNETIVEWAKRVHPETNIGTGYQLHVFSLRHAGKSHEAIWAAYTAQAPDVQPPPPPPPPPVGPDPLPPPTGGVTIRDFRATRFQTMDDCFLVTPVLAIRFRTPAVAGAAGWLTTAEYIGEQRYRMTWTSTSPGGPEIPGSRSGPATSTQTRFSIGMDTPGYVKLEPGQTYYFCVRGEPWVPEDAREQFLVGIGL